jgi:CxxC-x17-CxxC domain-containing protein
MDISYFGMGVDYSYECSVAGYRANHTLFCENVWESNDVLYSQLCTNNCHDLFGCVGMKHAQYCILNKQYTKEEYEKLAGEIIEHMKNDHSYGEFFPTKNSGFSYNETTAFEYFPIGKNDILNNETPNDIPNSTIICAESGRPFKLQSSELNFYRQMELPTPIFHPDVRHFHRLALRRPRKLFERTCSNCKKQITSSFSPDRSEKVYCEKCYLEAVY